MSSLKAPSRPTAAPEKVVQIICTFPPDVAAKIKAEAERNERTTVAQVRVIVRKWAQRLQTS